MANDKVWQDDDGSINVDFSGQAKTHKVIKERGNYTEYADIDLASGYHKSMIWTTKDGRRIAIPNMTDDHLLNTLAFLRRRVDNYKKQVAISALNTMSVQINLFDNIDDDWIDTAYQRFRENAKELFDMSEDDFLRKYIPKYGLMYQEAYRRKILLEVDKSMIPNAIKTPTSQEDQVFDSSATDPDQSRRSPKDLGKEVSRRYKRKSPPASTRTGQPLRDEVEELAEATRSMDGIEVHRDDWHYAEQVIMKYPKEFDLGSARGPNGDWKRLYLIEGSGDT